RRDFARRAVLRAAALPEPVADAAERHRRRRLGLAGATPSRAAAADPVALAAGTGGADPAVANAAAQCRDRQPVPAAAVKRRIGSAASRLDPTCIRPFTSRRSAPSPKAWSRRYLQRVH